MELRKEVKEARRITMLHGPSKVMDMEYEIQGLRQQLTEKSQEVVVLRKKVIPSHPIQSNLFTSQNHFSQAVQLFLRSGIRNILSLKKQECSSSSLLNLIKKEREINIKAERSSKPITYMQSTTKRDPLQ